MEFAINNKTHSETKVSSFIKNYKRELMMGANIKRKEKVNKMTDFAKIIKRIQKKVGATLKKVQEEMERQTDEERKEVEVWKKRGQCYVEYERLSVQRLTGKEISESLYIIEEVVFTNAVKLKLPTIIRIHPVVK